MSKLYTAFLVLSLFFIGQSFHSFASNANLETDEFTNIDFNAKVVEGRTYVSAKAVFESLGWEVIWVSKDRTIIVAKGDKEIVLRIDSKQAIINGENAELAGTVRIIDGKSYIPADFVVEQFGEEVKWDDKGNIIIVSTDFDANIIVNGQGNIVIADTKGKILNIFGPINSDTAYDLLSTADTLLESNNTLKAIEKYEKVLKGISKEQNPKAYAHASKGIGDAYSTLAQMKDTKTNIKIAISSYEDAITIYSAENNPINYFIALNNLGNAYKALWKVTEKNDDLIKAANYYEQSLAVEGMDNKYILDYAFIKYNMGFVYIGLKHENLAKECLLEAKDIYENQLEKYDYNKDSYTWSSIQYNLGSTYKLLSKLMFKKEYLEKAIVAYNKALEVRSIESYPLDYADLHRCLGELYSDVAYNGICEGSLEKALEEYQESLKIYLPERYPVYYATVCYEMGNLYMFAAYAQKNDISNFVKANKSYKEVIKVHNMNGSWICM